MPLPFRSSRPRLKRRDERFSADGLSCALGEVADLSASGMRVRCNVRPRLQRGQTVSFTLTTASQKISTKGRVAWVRGTPLLRSGWTIGVQFTDTRPSFRAAMARLAKFGHFDKAANDEPAARNSAAAVAAAAVTDYYAILGVPPESPGADIRDAFRRLAKELHPDVNPSREAAARFALVQEAHGVLGDPLERERYDELLRHLRSAA